MGFEEYTLQTMLFIIALLIIAFNRQNSLNENLKFSTFGLTTKQLPKVP